MLGNNKQWIACPELPDLNEVRGLYRRVRSFVGGSGEDIVIVAVGGGSVIDLAKVMSLARSGVEFDLLFEERIAHGKRIDSLEHVPVIAVPTTAGTGSEVTPWAAIWDNTAMTKYSVQGHSLWAEAAIVDPSLSASCPGEVTRNCALDALSHSLEAIWNRNHNPVSDVLAVAAAKGILRHLPVVLSQDERDGSDDDVAIRRARTGLSTAAVRAGLAFSNTETALAHALSYRLTIEKGVKHGVACSFSLPRVMRLAMGVDEGRDAVIQAVFSDFRQQTPTHTQTQTQDQQPWKHLDGWLNEVGVSTCLEDYGFAGEADFRERCAVGVTNRRGRNFLGRSV